MPRSTFALVVAHDKFMIKIIVHSDLVQLKYANRALYMLDMRI